jgi:hypothetical protein
MESKKVFYELLTGKIHKLRQVYQRVLSQCFIKYIAYYSHDFELKKKVKIWKIRFVISTFISWRNLKTFPKVHKGIKFDASHLWNR